MLGELSAKVIRELALRTLTHDVRQDFDIWEHRTHVAKPALAGADGPIGRYRKWVRQFDPSSEPS